MATARTTRGVDDDDRRALQTAAASSVGGLVGFYAGFVATHGVAFLTKTTASTWRGSVLGAVGLVASCAASGAAASWAREAFDRSWMPRLSAVDWGALRTNARLAPSVEAAFGRERKDQALSGAVLCVSGAVVFGALGGRCRSFALSRYEMPGAFARPRKALPTGTDYADAREKARIAVLGRKHGCHTCGDKKARQYIADHMPPNKFAKEANARFLRRVTGIYMRQHFYPQCADCSSTQSHVVRLNLPWTLAPLKAHFLRFRLYHLTGLLLGPFFTEIMKPNLDVFHAMAETTRVYIDHLIPNRLKS